MGIRLIHLVGGSPPHRVLIFAVLPNRLSDLVMSRPLGLVSDATGNDVHTDGRRSEPREGLEAAEAEDAQRVHQAVTKLGVEISAAEGVEKVRLLWSLAEILQNAGDWKNLLSAYNNIIYHSLDNDDVLNGYAKKAYVLWQKLQLPVKAREHYHKALQLDPDYLPAVVGLAVLSLGERDWNAAGTGVARLSDSPVEGSVRVAVLVVQAVIAMATGEEAEAKRLYEQAGSLDSPLQERLRELSIQDYEAVAAELGQRLATVFADAPRLPT